MDKMKTPTLIDALVEAEEMMDEQADEFRDRGRTEDEVLYLQYSQLIYKHRKELENGNVHP